MAAEGIATVVCLVPDGDIERESPDYAEWRRANRSDPHWTLFDFPVRDFAAPDPGDAEEFRRVVSDVATLVGAGRKVYVHCSA